MRRDDEEEEEEEDEGINDGLQDDEGGSRAYTMNFRMYENKFPEIDDVVMVQVRSIAEMGAYVSLLECACPLPQHRRHRAPADVAKRSRHPISLLACSGTTTSRG